MQASQMSGLLQKGEITRLAEMLRTNQQILNEAYTDTRQAINHLRLSPQPGVKSWLKEAVMDFRRVSQIDVDTELQQDPENLPIEIQSQLIRIIQEALNNIRKHARAGHVWISFHTYLGDLVLEIHDDGRGFLAEDVPSLSQYGLRGMRERAEMIGAEFQIISQPGSGTTIRLQLPYAYSQEAPL
jgi:signal transduction histidine kinase